MQEILVPISFFLGTFAMVFGIRYLSNKEKMAMIERGIDPGISKSVPKPYLSLKFGLLMVGLGLGLLIALLTVKNVYGSNIGHAEEGQVAAIYFGFLGIFGGFGLITSFIIEKKAIDHQSLKS